VPFYAYIITLADLPYYEVLETERIPHYRQRTVFDSKHEEYDIEEIEDEEAGYICSFEVSEIRKEPEDFDDLLTILNDDNSVI